MWVVCMLGSYSYMLFTIVFKHATGQDIFLLDWRQVLSYDVSFLNIRLVVNSVINLVNNKIHILKYVLGMFSN
jgi:hypothetical protein